ncbi:Arginine deiminase [Halanaeroarchaeum sp. HSR-CO]|uniref:arginine deiminase family protein n=1 Tax=Halanaeroarchaeum sp. HSR-CO TaxID=2866382 RepID=UPI00217D4D38|nr:arginine deiminase family protein [Halanaeroarchaeum sp. HSR-CO]UWG46968.1 Arginine deiminase [Halanaeroarchaeum sp. HSR-CO]
MTTRFSASAEFDRLQSVRVHEPGLEIWSGAIDPASHLFESPVAPDQARRQHRRYVDVLAANGVTVHTLAGDLAAADALDDLVAEYATVESAVDLGATLATLDPHEKLQLALARARIGPGDAAPASLHVERPISNIFFQRDTTILGDRGPILCTMRSPVRQPEVSIVDRAWEGIGADVVHRASTGPIEGGEFLPLGEFALLGVSGVVDGEEHVIRTSYAAGRALLDAGAVGYDEVGLVRAPIEADRALAAEHDAPSRLMHLLGWVNVAAEGLAVTFPTLARAADVDVFGRTEGGYERRETVSLATYLDRKGYDVIAASHPERWPTNFVAIDDGVVVPLYEPDESGDYRPENNPTIEAMKERGVTIVPDGVGLPTGPLTNGAGGLHCMTTPVNRA